MEIILALGLIGLIGFLLWRSNERRGQRFTRAVHFLNELEEGATVDEANGRVARLFTKKSKPEDDVAAIHSAIDRAQWRTNGNQLPWIHEAREKGFIVDSGNERLDLASLHNMSTCRSIGKNVGSTVREEITAPFKITGSAVPKGLFLDPYVAGFAVRLLTTYSSSAGALEMTPEEFRVFSKAATQSMLSSQYQHEFEALPADSESYQRGAREALIFIVATLKPSALDQTEAIVLEAIELAKTRSGLVFEAGQLIGLKPITGPEAEHNALVSAVKSLTLGKHFKENYRLVN